MDDATRTMREDEYPESAPSFWGAFRLIEKVGQGSFGEVFRAWDPALEREVALKLLKQSSAAEGSTREVNHQSDYQEILREARLMARVRHPNIVAVHGVDRHNGRVGFWSDFVRGKTLAELEKVQGPFNAREAAFIGIELCRAVSAVHAAGLLHRDIKTGNVMREEGGRILLMDFGLTHESGGGRFGGTIAYMAPELLAGGEPSTRSDLYALGVLLFHLVTGKFPLDSSGARLSLMSSRADLPVKFVLAVEKAIDPDPKHRFASAGEMLVALSDPTDGAAPIASRRRWRLAWVAVPALAAALVAMYWIGPKSSKPGLFSSARADYEKAQDFLDHYYRAGNIDKAIPLFEKTILADPKFALAHDGLGRAYSRKYLEASDAKLKQTALQECEKAIELDPNIASAHVTLASIYAAGGQNDLATQEIDKALRLDANNADAYGAQADLLGKQGRKDDAEAALEKAMDLAPADWRWPDRLGLHYYSLGNFVEAEKHYQKAVALAPDNPDALNRLGLAYKKENRVAEAKATFEKAIQIEPRYSVFSNLGNIYWNEGKYPEAAENYRHAIELNPRNYVARGNLASALKQIPGQDENSRQAYQEAIRLAESALASKPKDATILSSLGRYYADLGNADKSILLLKQSVALAPEDPSILFSACQGYELLHRRDDALRALAKAFAHGLAEDIDHYPELSELRADPRFASLSRAKVR